MDIQKLKADFVATKKGRPPASQVERECNTCHKVKLVIEFHKAGINNGYQQYRGDCKECRKEWHKNNPAPVRAWSLKTNYGISMEDYDNMLKSQGGVCFLCGEPEKQRKHLAVDHCHRTGKVRGLLCTTCNVGLGNLKDDPEILEKAAKYLRSHANG